MALLIYQENSLSERWPKWPHKSNDVSECLAENRIAINILPPVNTISPSREPLALHYLEIKVRCGFTFTFMSRLNLP